jgi:cystathionine beta-lyase family protein involved in aluminum resistance
VLKEQASDLMIFVDNCYGEFVADIEPCAVGADLIAGSLIKNPGAGLVTSGGYVVGKREAVDKAATRLTMPGLGSEMGATSGEFLRLSFMGLYLAPHIISQALKTAHLFAFCLKELGFRVDPEPLALRHDIIQAVYLGEAKLMQGFVQKIQSLAAVDAFLATEAAEMPGYESKVIMASGSFIQGSSIELSCDAPLREPYIAYLQGGLTYEHGKIAVKRLLQSEMFGLARLS